MYSQGNKREQPKHLFHKKTTVSFWCVESVGVPRTKKPLILSSCALQASDFFPKEEREKYSLISLRAFSIISQLHPFSTLKVALG